MEYQIGEFSCIVRITVKTLRFYHEEGLLLPARVDGFTGYRYYNRESADRAQLITTLRGLDFSIEEIRHIIADCKEDGDLSATLSRKAESMREAMRSLHMKTQRIQQIIQLIEGDTTMNANQEILIKDFPAELAATIRFHGKYTEIGQYFGQLFKASASKMAGKPFALYHDNEFKENDADIEAGLPIRSAITKEGIACRTLPGCQCLVVVHQGSYDSLSGSYEKLFAKMNSLGLSPGGPIRETYLKGPGMIFRGNPRNYLTEIRLPVTTPAAAPK